MGKHQKAKAGINVVKHNNEPNTTHSAGNCYNKIRNFTGPRARSLFWKSRLANLTIAL